MTKQRILVIEDDAAIRRGVLASLRFHGYDTLEAADDGVGRELALREDYDLLLLDLNLPGGDGLDILTAVRERQSALPVILLTARGAEEDRVRGLKLGADDYVVKPFSVSELMARIEAVLRRSPSRPVPVVTVAVPGVNWTWGKRELRFEDGRRTPLSERESELLAYLVRHAGRAVARDEILAQVWRLNPDAVETRTVDMHIVRLREKLGDDGAAPRIILTLRGRGYQFVAAAP